MGTSVHAAELRDHTGAVEGSLDYSEVIMPCHVGLQPKGHRWGPRILLCRLGERSLHRVSPKSGARVGSTVAGLMGEMLAMLLRR